MNRARELVTDSMETLGLDWERATPHDRCHRCQAPSNGYHHDGCVREDCPRCGGLMIVCRCFADRLLPRTEAGRSGLALLERGLGWLAMGIGINELSAKRQEILLSGALSSGLALLPDVVGAARAEVARRRRPEAPSRPRPVRKQGLYEKEISSLEEAVALDPAGIGAHLRLGDCTRRAGRHERSAQCFARALELDRRCAEAWAGMAATHNDTNRPLQALEASETACALEPASARAWFERGRALHTLGRLPDAVTAFERVVELDPSNMSAWALRGVCQRVLRRIRVEMGLIATHPRLGPTERIRQSPEELAERWGVSLATARTIAEGIRLCNQSQLESAARLFEEVCTAAPEVGFGWRSRAQCLRALGRSSEAIECYRRAIGLAAEPEDEIGMGHCLLDGGDVEGALAAFDRVLAANRASADAWYGRSLALERSGDSAASLAAYDRFVELAAAGAGGRADRSRTNLAEARRVVAANEHRRRNLE